MGDATERPCTFAGCAKRHKGHGWCATHLAQMRRAGRVWPIRDTAVEHCAFDGCGRLRSAKGFCAAHYRMAHEGRPLKPIRERPRRILCRACNTVLGLVDEDPDTLLRLAALAKADRQLKLVI